MRAHPLPLLLILATCLAGCGTAESPNGHHGHRGRHGHHAGAADIPESPAIQVGADSVSIMGAGSATFDHLRGLVDGAHRSIHLEMYELGRPEMAAALVRAHARGVATTVILDTGVPVTSGTATILRGAGIDVLDYPTRRGMIDHVKLLVVDATVAAVGGINWGTGSHRNHDFDAVLTGPAVANLERQFSRDLLTCGRAVPVADAIPDPAVLVAATQPGADIHPLALRLLADARERLDLEQYVLTDSATVHELEAARRRGVLVRLLLDPSERPSDGPAERLRAAGVEVRLYRGGGEKLHAKMAVADGRSILFGSANWTAGGFTRNHEIDIEITDSPGVAAVMEQHMSADWQASGP